MTTYTTYVGGEDIAGSSGGNYAGSPKQTVLTGTFDAAKRGLAAADVATVVNIPAGTHVSGVFVEVLTVDDATHVFNVGDGAAVAGHVSGADAATLGLTQGAGTLIASTTLGKLYTAADTIDIEAATGDPLDTLKVRISVVCTIV